MKITDEMVEGVTEAFPREEKTATYRVLKREDEIKGEPDDEVGGRFYPLWSERQRLEITAPYPYPNAQRVGEQYGEGEYILLSDDRYPHVTYLTVVADKVYREQEKS